VHKRSVIISTTVAAAIAISGLGAALTARTHVPPRVIAAPSGEITWKKIVLDPEFRSEGVAVADVNHDRKLDVLAGNVWYEAPNWTPHEIAPVQKFDGAHGYSNCFLSWAADVNRDGWMDQIVVQFPGDKAVWRENPKNKPGPWKEHIIWRSACNESPAFADLLGNKKPVLVFPYDEKIMAWYEPGKDRTREFINHDVGTEKQPGVERFSHGMGVGDINGDGHPDIITTQGYYEAPEDPRSGPWKFVPANLGPECGQMVVYDVNGDGLPDVISSSAHNIGVWWYEQKKGPNGPEFEQHLIDNSFSQSHSLVLADINHDGVMDIVTGKRFWAHGPTGDVNPDAPAMLYWFELKRKKGKVEWIRHEIDNDSGVGTQFQVIDVNKDGLLDVVTSNKKGVHVFLQQRTKKR
jgi:hypothetical protein